eukprot:Hpha_TRINITY_DN15139_c4_g1::TRINITY_DN15139_c4_g1_i2::g.127042::m.127042
MAPSRGEGYGSAMSPPRNDPPPPGWSTVGSTFTLGIPPPPGSPGPTPPPVPGPVPGPLPRSGAMRISPPRSMPTNGVSNWLRTPATTPPPTSRPLVLPPRPEPVRTVTGPPVWQVWAVPEPNAPLIASGRGGTSPTRPNRTTPPPPGSSQGGAASVGEVASDHTPFSAGYGLPGLRLNEADLYEAKNSDGVWWAVTLTQQLTQETFTAVVHDAVGTLWTDVHIANIRPTPMLNPDSAYEFEVEKGPGESLGIKLEHGMVLGGVNPGGPAALAGVGRAEGRQLTHVNGQPVRSVPELIAMSPQNANIVLRFGPLLESQKDSQGEEHVGTPHTRNPAENTPQPTPPRQPRLDSRTNRFPTGVSTGSWETPPTELESNASLAARFPAAGGGQDSGRLFNRHPATGLAIVDMSPQEKALFAPKSVGEGRRLVLHFSGEVKKVSRKGRLDPRVLVVSDKGMFLCHTDGRVFRSLAVTDLLEAVAGDIAGGSSTQGAPGARARPGLALSGVQVRTSSTPSAGVIGS